jgi:HJR/Mrr/RecB family endonuclease
VVVRKLPLSVVLRAKLGYHLDYSITEYSVFPQFTKPKLPTILQKTLKKKTNKLSNLTSIQEFLFFKLLFSLTVHILVRKENSKNLLQQASPIANLIYKQQIPLTVVKFLPSLSVLFDSLNFSRFGEHLSQLFSVLSRKDLRKFFRFLTVFISSLKFVGLLGSKIFYKGKLS